MSENTNKTGLRGAIFLVAGVVLVGGLINLGGISGQGSGGEAGGCGGASFDEDTGQLVDAEGNAISVTAAGNVVEQATKIKPPPWVEEANPDKYPCAKLDEAKKEQKRHCEETCKPHECVRRDGRGIHNQGSTKIDPPTACGPIPAWCHDGRKWRKYQVHTLVCREDTIIVEGPECAETQGPSGCFDCAADYNKPWCRECKFTFGPQPSKNAVSGDIVGAGAAGAGAGAGAGAQEQEGGSGSDADQVEGFSDYR